MKFYEIKKIGGTQKYLVVEFWEGGVVRGPFLSEEGAQRAELALSQERGWTDLQKV